MRGADPRFTLHESFEMLHTIGKTASLRTWIAFGMALAVLPLAAAGGAGYLIIRRGVLADFQDVAARDRQQVDPTQELRLRLLDAEAPLDDFMDQGDPRDPLEYRARRGEIESDFAALHQSLAGDPESRALLERARADWTAADRVATEALSVRRPAGDTSGGVLMDRFQGLIGSSTDKLGALYASLTTDLHADHDQALRDADRSDWIAGIAAGVSLLAILAGVLVIGRVMSASVERLVDGAERFAAGNRDHRIDIALPPELHRVAQEFNKMIGRIHESESAMADLARRDALTLLLNRRAFDEEIAEALARQQRFGERFALLAIDLDHFKQINDAHGHGGGDDVLRMASRVLTAEVRPFDRVFRTGGEEFNIILPRADVEIADSVAERLRHAVAAHPVMLGDVAVQPTVSVGVAVADGTSDATAIIGAADAALYRAKREGRNRVVREA